MSTELMGYFELGYFELSMARAELYQRQLEKEDCPLLDARVNEVAIALQAWKQPEWSQEDLDKARVNSKFKDGLFSLFQGIIKDLTGKSKQEQTTFQIASWWRQGKDDYDLVFVSKKTGGQIILGAQPNSTSYRKSADGRKISDGENLKEMGVGRVFSINSEWERTPRGDSFPYREQDWNANGIDYMEIDIADHVALSVENLDKSADWIAEGIAEGDKLYVHCRGGSGRSAMAIAAYLIKYEGFTPEEARDFIQRARPKSTIGKKQKMANLRAFYAKCNAPPEK